MVHDLENTPDVQPQDQEDVHVKNHPNPGWFTKKSGSANAIRRTTWFDLLLKSYIDQNKNHILRPSTMAIAKKLKELIQKDELTLAYLKGVGLEKLKQQYKNDVKLGYHVDQLKAAMLTEAQWNSGEGNVSKPRSFERHMSKSTKTHPSFYNNDFYYLVNLTTSEEYTTSFTKHYAARVEVWEQNKVLAGFGIGGKIGKGLYKLGCDRGRLKMIKAYKDPTIHTTSSPKVVEREPEVTKDTMPPTNNGSTEDIPPPVVPIIHHESISKPANAPVSASRPNQKASSPCPFEEEFDERTKS
ncbi:hypothetical protein Tco_0519722 [Tanacetum coccineum]